MAGRTPTLPALTAGQTKAWIKTHTGKNLTVIGELPVFAP